MIASPRFSTIISGGAKGADSLAKKLSGHVGVFDYSKMTKQEVAEYGVKSLKLQSIKGHEVTAMDVFLSVKDSPSFKSSSLDSANVSKCDQVKKYMRGEE